MSVSPFPFAARLAFVRAIMREMDLDALVVTHPPNVRYMTGFAGSTGALVIDHQRWSLIVDFRYLTSARALQATNPELASLGVVLSDRNENDAVVKLLEGEGPLRVGIEATWMPVARFNRLSSLLAAGVPTPLNSVRPCPVLVAAEPIVERSRVIKDEREVSTLRRAAAMLSRVAREVVPGLVQAGRTEADVAAGIDAALREEGFQRPAFETIVASGPNSALPHARPGGRVLQQGDPVVLDFGGVYDGYCVDLTRTVQLAPSNPAFRRLFASVVEAHDAAIAAVRPGRLTTDIDYAARQTLDRLALGEAFGHGTGHGLGLEVHEDPRISKADPSRPAVAVMPGMVFTIEPGVYVPGVGGVRIEDDVLVVEGGCELLTRVPIDFG